MTFFYSRTKKPNTGVAFCSIVTIMLIPLMVSMVDNVFAIQENKQTIELATAIAQEQTNINATNLYDSGQMVLGNSIKHLVILIPNEGHHGPGEEDEARFIAQPFVPQHAVISPGTEVVWFNGDIGHEHNIVVTSTDTTGTQTGQSSIGTNGTQLFNSGEFIELEASTPYTFNQVGEFNYADTIDYEEGFRMTGKITVVDQEPTDLSSNTGNGIFDTVGALMVPSEDSQAIVQGLRTAGFSIDGTANFQDLRSAGDDDSGDQQTLLVWTTNGKETSEITSALQQISQDLPYG
jgi:plastocyanin